MSRIGNAPILIPSGITVEKTGNSVVVSGPKGSLTIKVVSEIKVDVESNQVIVKRKNEQKRTKSLHGLMRNLIANMITGVQIGFNRNLQLVGVGFRGQTDGSKLILNIGFSHPVEILAPEGIRFEVGDNTNIVVSGIDKQLVGQVAANIRKIKVPDVYKGKGIRMVGEYIRKKIGKAAKVGAIGGGAK